MCLGLSAGWQRRLCALVLPRMAEMSMCLGLAPGWQRCLCALALPQDGGDVYVAHDPYTLLCTRLCLYTCLHTCRHTWPCTCLYMYMATHIAMHMLMQTLYPHPRTRLCTCLFACLWKATQTSYTSAAVQRLATTEIEKLNLEAELQAYVYTCV